MKQFDFYEFAGILAPGAVTVYGLALIYPELGLLVREEKVSFGELGIILILAYVVGHLVQAFGNLIEWVWWKCFRGWPSDWVRTHKHNMLALAQWNILAARIQELTQIECSGNLVIITEKDWKAITRQVYAVVKKSGQAERVDIFNGNYGLFRGVAASLIIIIVAALIDTEKYNWRLYGALGVMFGLALTRMHRFGIHYSRELFVQFLNTSKNEVGELDKVRRN